MNIILGILAVLGIPLLFMMLSSKKKPEKKRELTIEEQKVNSGEIIHTIFKLKHPEEYKVFDLFTSLLANAENEPFLSASVAKYHPEVIKKALLKFIEIARSANNEELQYTAATAIRYLGYIRPDAEAKRLNQLHKSKDPNDITEWTTAAVQAIKFGDEISRHVPYLVEIEKQIHAKN